MNVCGELLAGVRVLVVADDEPAAESLSEVLAGAGAAVRVARSVPSAIAQLQIERADVVISAIYRSADDLAIVRAVRDAFEPAARPAILVDTYGAVPDAWAHDRVAVVRLARGNLVEEVRRLAGIG